MGFSGSSGWDYREFGMGVLGRWSFPNLPGVRSAQLSSCTKSLPLNPKSFFFHDKHSRSRCHRCKIQDPPGTSQGRPPGDIPAVNPNPSPAQQP